MSHAQGLRIIVGCLPRIPAKEPQEVKRGMAGLFSQMVQAEVFRQMFANID